MHLRGVYGRSEGFPLTGIFHPRAQWDMGLDTLDAFAVVVSSSALGREGNFSLSNMLAIKEPTSKLDNFIGTLVGNLKSLEP